MLARAVKQVDLAFIFANCMRWRPVSTPIKRCWWKRQRSVRRISGGASRIIFRTRAFRNWRKRCIPDAVRQCSF